MGHSWMNALRTSEEYENGVEEFIEFARRNVATKNGMYYCPCVNCLNGSRRDIADIRDHLLCDGIHLRYTTWIWHGEEVSTGASHVNEVEVDDDGMEKMIHDVEAESFAQSGEYESVRSDAETPLFPGCTKYTRLTGTLHLVNLKATCGWTDSSFTSLLELLCDMLPDIMYFQIVCMRPRKSCLRWVWSIKRYTVALMTAYCTETSTKASVIVRSVKLHDTK